MTAPVKDFLRIASEQEARKLVQKYGYLGAVEWATAQRDKSSPGTMTFALHNQICKALIRFATVGHSHRTIHKGLLDTEGMR